MISVLITRDWVLWRLNRTVMKVVVYVRLNDHFSRFDSVLLRNSIACWSLAYHLGRTCYFHHISWRTWALSDDSSVLANDVWSHYRIACHNLRPLAITYALPDVFIFTLRTAVSTQKLTGQNYNNTLFGCVPGAGWVSQRLIMGQNCLVTPAIAMAIKVSFGK
ncbi:hypothetical protein TcasGA2_TC013238 [Tribolium castaneum]|uniref:Uncharacterized protein n=1 Tax=Tribolium castaneum TaxID=7070 RepID=D6WMH1_TRICA|nr:hypothetical protein TcasGA2_TC013238 [Tribolium castaneum]